MAELSMLRKKMHQLIASSFLEPSKIFVEALLIRFPLPPHFCLEGVVSQMTVVVEVPLTRFSLLVLSLHHHHLPLLLSHSSNFGGTDGWKARNTPRGKKKEKNVFRSLKNLTFLLFLQGRCKIATTGTFENSNATIVVPPEWMQRRLTFLPSLFNF